MSRTRLTYADAVRLLTGGTDVVTVLGRLAGGVLLASVPFAGDALALFDAKGEANALLRDLLGRAPGRIRAARGRRHYELIEAAHAILVISSFFDALAEVDGPLLAAVELTDADKRRIADGTISGFRPLVPRMPGATRGFVEHSEEIAAEFVTMHAAFVSFASGLTAAEGRSLPVNGEVADRARAIYQERFVRLAADIPEFAIWAQLGEHAATRDELRGQTETLARVEELLARVADRAAPGVETERRLARHAARVLGQPLWRGGAPAPAGLTFPTVEQGFVSPRFRIAHATDDARPGDEAWWLDRPIRDDLAEFLAACMTDSEFMQRPLVVLGHPGAGKSLLTEVLAARLPPAAFTTVHVPLRRVAPDADIHRQIEAAVERVVKEHIAWAELSRTSDTTKVVLLDGFDELVQATGVANSHYLDKVAAFQQDEWVNERPVLVVVTSRSLVMDRIVTPPGTVVVKLEPFDDTQVERWATAWNYANAGLRALTVAELTQHAALARQPLLLLMLAVYAAETGARLDGDELSAEELYRRLLDSFIRRQVREKADDDLGDAAFARLETAARHDLAAAAFAMFNRGRQYVSEADLNLDLEALRPAAGRPEPRLGEPLTRAKRTVAGFFFVHVAQADDDSRAPGRRTYEFLHATFAEYLVAEHTVELLDELADDRGRQQRRAYGTGVDERPLRTLLSHHPLATSGQVGRFLARILSRRPESARADIAAALVERFHVARTRVEDGPYRPTPFDAVRRLAAYTANLVTLITLSRPAGVEIRTLEDHPDAPGFAAAVRLWRCGLDDDGQNGLFRLLVRDGDRICAGRLETESLALSEARLIGDVFTESLIQAGRVAWRLPPDGTRTVPVTPQQRDHHVELLRTALARWPVPRAARMLPYDERRYEAWAGQVEAGEDALHPATAALLALCLVNDGTGLSPELAERLVQLVLSPDLVAAGQPMLAVLATHRPELWARFPLLRTGLPTPTRAVFAYQAAVAAGLAPAIDELGRAVTATSGGRLGPAVLPSTIAALDVLPTELITSLITELTAFDRLEWSQVQPVDLVAVRTFVEARGLAAHLSDAVANYVQCRAGDTFTGAQADAFAALRAWSPPLDGSAP
ncbi:NACHT domain-containing protein [Dactylosporangium sp. NPDC051541]|uniref:NACHT domain-containing protein n=1 Tax=Dactylosporangium sp. NPDC051541 TaxID=3363977 RepID=UPI00379846E8